jgi:hypothetical protein
MRIFVLFACIIAKKFETHHFISCFSRKQSFPVSQGNRSPKKLSLAQLVLESFVHHQLVLESSFPAGIGILVDPPPTSWYREIPILAGKEDSKRLSDLDLATVGREE